MIPKKFRLKFFLTEIFFFSVIFGVKIVLEFISKITKSYSIKMLLHNLIIHFIPSSFGVNTIVQFLMNMRRMRNL